MICLQWDQIPLIRVRLMVPPSVHAGPVPGTRESIATVPKAIPSIVRNSHSPAMTPALRTAARSRISPEGHLIPYRPFPRASGVSPRAMPCVFPRTSPFPISFSPFPGGSRVFRPYPGVMIRKSGGRFIKTRGTTISPLRTSGIIFFHFEFYVFYISRIIA